jgi:putative methyltransferase
LITAVPTLSKLARKTGKSGQPVNDETYQAIFYIAIYDLLFGKNKKIQGGGFVKKQVLLHTHALKAALVRLKIKHRVTSDEDLLPEENRILKEPKQLPRYARINTLKVPHVVVTSSTVDSLKKVLDLPVDLEMTFDPHIRDLLMFPPGTELHAHTSVTTGQLILQDKASCFPAFILHGGQHGADDTGDVIDACAARMYTIYIYIYIHHGIHTTASMG